MVQVESINAFDDNYIWAIRHTKTQQTWVVDPGQADPVFTYLKEKQASLAGILITHHHWDHTNGVEALQEAFSDLTVYGPLNSPFKGITHPVKEGDTVDIFTDTFSIIETPGHTLDHICYGNARLCFTGDTLFSAGCGRLFEGTAEQMWHSFNKFSRFCDDTLIYCTHEYTAANLAFAKAVEPNNPIVQAHIDKVTALRRRNEPSLPSQFGLERKINPFLRASQPHMLDQLPQHLTKENQKPWDQFAAIRSWKDEF